MTPLEQLLISGAAWGVVAAVIGAVIAGAMPSPAAALKVGKKPTNGSRICIGAR